jgi:leader peptidase (prepilin peptidase)/N-methyltransferase
MLWLVLLAVVAGDVVAVLIFRRVLRLGHRRPNEAPTSRPPLWWLAFLGLAWGWLTWFLGNGPWPILALWLPLSAAFAWLAAIDLDVSRLPDRILLPTAIWTVLCIALTMWITDPAAGVNAFLAALVSAGGFGVIHFVGRGELGFGDVKLAAIIGAATVLVSWAAVAYALLAGCILAIAWALARRDRVLAFAPWLALGAVMAVGLAR